MRRRSWFVIGLLVALWCLIIGWQVAEHFRVRKAARVALMHRGRDISTTLGLVVRSQRRFGGMISKDRIESALSELIRPGDVEGLALLNTSGDVVASAGDMVDLPGHHGLRDDEVWGRNTVTMMNVVDLGPVNQEAPDRPSTTIVLPRRERSETNRPPPPPPTPPSREANGGGGSNEVDALRDRRPPEWFRGRGTNEGERWRRPFGMSEEEYQSLLKKQGVHSFVIVMSTDSVRVSLRSDLWLRLILAGFATIAVVGSALAWRSFGRSSDLQLRLIRASELNSHLKEMNLAAAGLAHETRNPLNIIRGLAQLVSKKEEASLEVRQKSREITEEVDRVTAQLNEFINYARPREVKRTAVQLPGLLAEIARTLSYDIEEKSVQFNVSSEPLVIEADEQLLRQAVFNLALNAVQAVEGHGHVELRATRVNGTARLEIRDDGPGVRPEHRQEIFKPYFTANAKGTGLGLAVVQQIVLAHGWEIACLPNEPRGAIFAISHLRVMNEG